MSNKPKYHFNPPPGWPQPPEGWIPPKGWKPDPAWPDAPEGWQLWISNNDEHLLTQDPGTTYKPDNNYEVLEKLEVRERQKEVQIEQELLRLQEENKSLKEALETQLESSGLVELSDDAVLQDCLLYTSPSPRDKRQSRMPSSA